MMKIIFCLAQFQQAIAVAFELRKHYNHIVTKPSQPGIVLICCTMLPIATFIYLINDQNIVAKVIGHCWETHGILLRMFSTRIFGTRASVAVCHLQVVDRQNKNFFFQTFFLTKFFFAPTFLRNITMIIQQGFTITNLGNNH